jgi:hypothetical protein
MRIKNTGCVFVWLLLVLGSMCASAFEPDCFLPDIPPDKLNLMLGSVDKAAKAMYEARKPSRMPCSKQPIIPKLIHQIWIGKRELPPLRKAFMESWKKHHPDWSYKLWTNEDVENWQGKFYLKDLYDRAYTIQEKADILRLNIIYRYGGLYVDTDLECLKNFSPLHHKYKFYASTEQTLQLFASVPSNLVFEKIFHTIRARWDSVEQNFLKQNASIDRMYHAVSIPIDRCQGSFGREIATYCQSEPMSILLPANMMGYKINKQILFCGRMKLLRVLPALQNWSDDMFILEHAMAVQRWGTVRGTTLYNGIEKKIKIKMPKDGLYRRFRNWIHNNIDVHFIGCGDA